MTLVEVKTADLIGPALDWAVATIVRGGPIRSARDWSVAATVFRVEVPVEPGSDVYFVYAPSTDWSQGGPLVDREGTFRIIGPKHKGTTDHVARLPKGVNHWFEMCGPTPLVAAMRCLVASKLGDEVQVPKELLP